MQWRQPRMSIPYISLRHQGLPIVRYTLGVRCSGAVHPNNAAGSWLPCSAAGAGKTATLEGSKGRETWGTADGDGLVHLAIDEIFGLVHGKAITIGECWHRHAMHTMVGGCCVWCPKTVLHCFHKLSAYAGEAVAKRRRLPSSTGFDFFVESSFVEVYNESCRDLYSKSGPAGAPNLPVSVLELHMCLLTAATGNASCMCHCENSASG